MLDNKTMIEWPKVSIIIPVYNGSDYVSCAIDSALNQTYKNIEIIVVNDGSNDNGKTERILLSYGDKIKYFHKKNGGVSSALNYGIEQMTGDYFSWLSHDDVYSEKKVEDAINLLYRYGKFNKKLIAYTGGIFIDTAGKELYPIKKFFGTNILYNGKQVVETMIEKGTLSGCCLLIPKSVFSEVGYFNEDLRYSQDSLMWYNIFLKDYNLISDDNPNVMSRIHEKQVSLTRRDLFEHDILYVAKILMLPLEKLDSNANILYRYTKRLAKYQCNDAINYILKHAKKKKIFSFMQKMNIYIVMAWGPFRVSLAKIYKKYLLKKNKKIK